MHEIEIVKRLLDDVGGLFIDGNFFFGEEEAEEVGSSLMELLSESRRLPEMIIFLKVS